MTMLNRLPYQLAQADNFVLFEDWEGVLKLTDGPWSKLVAESGTATVADGLAGILTLQPSGGSPAASDEAYVYTTTQLFEPLSGQPLYFECLEQFAQVNTNQAGTFFGLASGVSAGGLITALSAGIRSTGTVIGFYTIAGNTNWQVIVQNAGSSSIQTFNTNVPAGLSTYQKLSFEIFDAISTTATVVFRIDDELVRNPAAQNVPLSVLMPLASDVFCSLSFGVKNGNSVTNGHESINVDYIAASQVRAYAVGADG